MPTDTLGAAGRSRCADPIGRARHSAECREAPGKSVEKPSRERVASDRFDRICKRGKRLPPKEAYPRRQRNPYRDDPSRRPCTKRRPNRPDNLRLPVDSSGTHIAGTPAGSVSAEEVRQRAKRPSVPRKPTHDRRMSSRLFLRAAGADSGNDFPARSLFVTGS